MYNQSPHHSDHGTVPPLVGLVLTSHAHRLLNVSAFCGTDDDAVVSSARAAWRAEVNRVVVSELGQVAHADCFDLGATEPDGIMSRWTAEGWEVTCLLAHEAFVVGGSERTHEQESFFPGSGATPVGSIPRGEENV